MSRTRIVKGIYSKITHGDHNMYSRGDINSFADETIRETGDEEGVRYGSPEEAPTTSVLKKFTVHFRRPDDYQGEYGFDWLRDEYINPVLTITNDNNGAPIGRPTPVSKNVNSLKQEYLRDVTSRISPYGQEYFPAWLSIFPHTSTAQFAHGSTMHKSGVNLDLQVDEIDSIANDGTEIIFEASDDALKIMPDKIPISEVLAARKQTKTISSRSVNYYLLKAKVNIKCEGRPLTRHQEIKVFAKLDTHKVEVGKLMVYKNNIIPKAEIVVVNVITSANRAALRTDYQYLFKNQSFNQALIRAEVRVDTEFDLTNLTQHSDVQQFLANSNTLGADQIRNSFSNLYNRYGKYSVSGGIDSNNTQRTYLFFTTLAAGNTLGICSLDRNTGVWGNLYVIFNAGLLHDHTIVHECGHSFSLPHVFQEGSMARHSFYHGYTDNYMDYTWQAGNIITVTRNGRRIQVLGSSGANKFDGKMFSFFKWQWDIMRNDRSLIFTY